MKGKGSRPVCVKNKTGRPVSAKAASICGPRFGEDMANIFLAVDFRREY
jgi:hypothetical protein